MSTHEGGRSALVVLVPEAEVLVKPFRDRYDPSAAEGMPEHITLLYPFCPPKDLDKSHIDVLRMCFATFPAFDFSLRTTGRFRDAVLYLAPQPDRPFSDLTTAIWERFSSFPPYSGEHGDHPPPHLTVAHIDNNKNELENIEQAFMLEARGKLPIRARASQVVLMANIGEDWKIRTSLGLGLEA